MPIYEYGCAQCGERVEVIHGVHATGPSTCARCGGAMRKLLSAPAIVFKGSGWAKKDARVSAGAGKGSTTEGGTKESAGSDGAGTDAGSAASSDAGGGDKPAATDKGPSPASRPGGESTGGSNRGSGSGAAGGTTDSGR